MRNDMSDTPRTDVSAFNIIDETDEDPRQHVYYSDGEYVGSNFARQLEREVAELERQIKELDGISVYFKGETLLDKMHALCRYYTDQIDELERQLETICNDTLEEAAKVCESAELGFSDRYDCADAIRKLKQAP